MSDSKNMPSTSVLLIFLFEPMLDDTTLVQSILELPCKIVFRHRFTETFKSRQPEDSAGNSPFYPQRILLALIVMHSMQKGDEYPQLRVLPSRRFYKIQIPQGRYRPSFSHLIVVNYNPAT
jgi:hypothetical protein